MSEAKAIRVWAAFIFKPSALERAITMACDGPWGHCALGFDLDDGTSGYYESLWQDGVCGPKPAAKLADLAKDPRNKLAVIVLDCDTATAEAIRQDAAGDVGKVGYAKVQLSRNALFERFWIPIPESPNRVHCAEFLARKLVRSGIDLRDQRRARFDEVNPCSAWRRLLEIRAGYGAATAPALAAPADGRR